MAKTVRLDNNGQAIKYSPLGAVAPVTLFPTTVETVKDTSVLAILTFYRFGGDVSLCDWSDIGTLPPTHTPHSLWEDNVTIRQCPHTTR